MVKEFLNNYFGFNRQQRNGLVVLMSISALLLIVRVTYPYFMTPGNVEIMNLPVFDTDSTVLANTNGPGSLSYFDPNTASKEELVRLGLKEKTAATLIRYRARYPFKTDDDLGKVYGISPALLNKLKPFVRIEDHRAPHGTRTEPKQSQPANAQPTTIELNGADSLQLLSLPGIGPAFAHRIIKYRALLGGFVNKGQLKEVYGFKQEAFDLVSPRVTVNASLVKKINVNKDDFKTVNRHPYISYELTKALFNKKRQQALDPQITREIMGNDSLYQQVLPYLEF